MKTILLTRKCEDKKQEINLHIITEVCDKLYPDKIPFHFTFFFEIYICLSMLGTSFVIYRAKKKKSGMERKIKYRNRKLDDHLDKLIVKSFGIVQSFLFFND